MAITVPRAERAVSEIEAPAPKLRDLPEEASGRHFGKATEKFLQMERDELRKANQDAVNMADIELDKYETEAMWGEDGALMRQGQSSIDRFDQDLKDFDSHTEKVMETLSNDVQRESFRQRAALRRQSVNEQLTRHVGKQKKKIRDDIFVSMIDGSVLKASRVYDSEQGVEDQLSIQKALISQYAKDSDMTGEARDRWVKDKVLHFASKTHKAVIKQMMVDDEDIRAEEYYKENKSEIIDKDGRVRERVMEASSAKTSIDMASKIWNDANIEDDDPIELDKLNAKVKHMNPKVEKLARAQLKDRTQVHKTARLERLTHNMGSVYGFIADGQGLSQIMSTPEYKALDGQNKVLVQRHFEARSRVTPKPTRDQLAQYFRLAESPEILRSLTVQQVDALVPELGQELVNRLQNQRLMLGRMDLTSVKITNQMFNDIMAMSKINVKKKDKTQISEIHGRVMDILAREQEAKGKKLTRDEIFEIMQKEVDSQVITDAGLFSFEQKRPAFLIPEEEIEDVEVPDNERLRISKELKPIGREDDSELIKRIYLAEVRGDERLREELISGL